MSDDFICLECGDRFTTRRALTAHHDLAKHSPFDVQQYALRRARAAFAHEPPPELPEGQGWGSQETPPDGS